MKVIKLMTLALAVTLPALALHAQDQTDNQNPPPPAQNDGPPDGGPRGHEPGRGHRPMMLIIAALDTNHDGVISAEEIANAPAALKTLDKNGDGQLTKDELMPPHPQHDGQDGPPPADAQSDSSQTRPQRPLPPIIAALDTNGDGVISADEIANASAALKQLDVNGDGQLTMDEIMPRGPHGGHGPDGHRPPPPVQNN